MNPDLQAILFRDNPWLLDPGTLQAWLRERLPSVFYPRHISSRNWTEENRAHLVIGPRQAGKSTVIWTHLAELGKPVLFIDCEQPLVQDWCKSAPLFLNDLEQMVARPVTLFLEEAQHLENAGLFVKGLVDRRIGVPVLITGSSSYHLRARTRESLAGRSTRTRLMPFSLAEVCDDLAARPPLVRARLLDDRFERHVRYGGYPDVWLSDTPEILLTELVEAFILRDASDLFRIQRPDAFRRLLHLLASQAGSLVNLSEWSSVLGVSRDTVASYLEILESSHVVSVVPPFAGGRRSELTRNPKVFFLDNGLRHQMLHDFKPLLERSDAGAAFESWVLGELWKTLPEGATLHFWRSTSKAEVDFVMVRGDRILAVEVKATALRRATLPRGARSFLDAYRPARCLMVNTGLEHRERVAETDVEWIRPPALAGKVKEVFAPSE